MDLSVYKSFYGVEIVDAGDICPEGAYTNQMQ